MIPKWHRASRVGLPWHGLSGGGTLTLPDDQTRAYPSISPGHTVAVINPVRAADADSDIGADGRQYRTYGLLSGPQHRIGPAVIGSDSWLYVDPSGAVWRLQIGRVTTEVPDLTWQVSLIAPFGRLGYAGPAHVPTVIGSLESWLPTFPADYSGGSTPSAELTRISVDYEWMLDISPQGDAVAVNLLISNLIDSPWTKPGYFLVDDGPRVIIGVLRAVISGSGVIEPDGTVSGIVATVSETHTPADLIIEDVSGQVTTTGDADPNITIIDGANLGTWAVDLTSCPDPLPIPHANPTSPIWDLTLGIATDPGATDITGAILTRDAAQLIFHVTHDQQEIIYRNVLTVNDSFEYHANATCTYTISWQSDVAVVPTECIASNLVTTGGHSAIRENQTDWSTGIWFGSTEVAASVYAALQTVTAAYTDDPDCRSTSPGICGNSPTISQTSYSNVFVGTNNGQSVLQLDAIQNVDVIRVTNNLWCLCDAYKVAFGPGVSTWNQRRIYVANDGTVVSIEDLGPIESIGPPEIAALPASWHPVTGDMASGLGVCWV